MYSFVWASDLNSQTCASVSWPQPPALFQGANAQEYTKVEPPLSPNSFFLQQAAVVKSIAAAASDEHVCGRVKAKFSRHGNFCLQSTGATWQSGLADAFLIRPCSLPLCCFSLDLWRSPVFTFWSFLSSGGISAVTWLALSCTKTGMFELAARQLRFVGTRYRA